MCDIHVVVWFLNIHRSEAISVSAEIDEFSMSHAKNCVKRGTMINIFQNVTLVCVCLWPSIKINSLSYNYLLSAKLKLFWIQIVLQLAFMKQHIQVCQFQSPCFLEWFPDWKKKLTDKFERDF